MRIVDINNHYIFKNLATDLDNCVTMTEVINVRQKALDSIDKDWPAPVKEILERHAFALDREAANALMVMDSLDRILEHKIFNGTVKERFRVYSDESTIDKAFEALKEELKTEYDDFTINKLEKCILERHLFELRENAKKNLKGRSSKELSSSYVFSVEFENMFNSANTKGKLDSAYAKAHEKVQGHEVEVWLIETGWIEMRTRIASLQLDINRLSDRDADTSDLWNSDLVQKFDIDEFPQTRSVDAQNLVVNRYDEFVSRCRLKNGKAAELAYKIFNLQFSLIAAQTIVDEHSDILGRIVGLKTLDAMLKASRSEVRLQNIDMGDDGRVSSIKFEAIDKEGI